MGLNVEVIPVLSRTPVRQGLREVGALRPPSTCATSVDAEIARLPLVVATVGHTVTIRLTRP